MPLKLEMASKNILCFFGLKLTFAVMRFFILFCK